MRIKEEFKRKGDFWLPSAPDEQVRGTLTISDRGRIELEVDGRLGTSIDNLERIVGYIQKGTSIVSIPVTLDDCYYKKISLSDSSESLIRASRVFEGFQYGEGETPHFNSLSFSVEGIDDWIPITGLKVEVNDKIGAPTIFYDQPADFSFKLENDMELRITWGSSWKHKFFKEAGISEKIFFQLVSKDSREIDEFISVTTKIIEFLCFAINETVCLDSMSATSDNLPQDIGDGKTQPKSIKIYYQSWPYAENEPKINQYNMLFGFTDIQNEAESIINNWINAYEQIAPAFRLYFLAKIGAQTYLEEKFLTLVQGLEAYHRRTCNDKHMDEDKFKKIVKNLIRQCPKKDRNWFSGKLYYANELTLRNRITKMIEPFAKFLGTDEKRRALIGSIVDTRNYLTHYDLSLETKAAKGKDLWALCDKMELLLELHFLQLTSFSQEKIDSIVAKCPKLKRKSALGR